MYKYIKTAHLAALEKTNCGLLYLLPDVLIKIFTLIPLIYLWRSVLLSGAQVDMTFEQMLSYTYLSALLADLLVIKTPACGWLSEGVILKLYGRPMAVLGQLVAITFGGLAPMLLLFSLPMAFAAPLVGVSLLPAPPLFFISLLFTVSIGFGIDILFACLSMKLRNMSWLIFRIRAAIITLLSGAFIPIALMPPALVTFIKYQPFASLGGAPLSIFIGSGNPGQTLLIQLGWNLVIWPVALFIFKKSQEGMVSYGG